MADDLKIYIAEYGWAGCIIVIAGSEEAARELMAVEPNYNPNTKLVVKGLGAGWVHANYGDS